MSYGSAHTPLIVVGVDGSPSSVPVLTWAARQARSVGGRVRVVTAWRFPEVPGHRPMRVEADLSAAVEGIVAGLVARTLSDVPSESVVQEDSPIHLLLREATDADLVVVGSRGSEHDDPAVLGSVAQACLLAAPCPVVVVPVAASVARTTPPADHQHLAGSAGQPSR